MPGQAGEPEPAQQRGTTPRQRQPKIRMRAANAFTGTDPSRPKGSLKAKALVLAVKEYARGFSLQNTINDANAVAKRLTEIGFDVHVISDETIGQRVTQKLVKKYLREFVDEVDHDTVAAFAFMGHGAEFHGRHYLLGYEMVEDPAALPDEAVSHQELLGRIEKKQPLCTLAFLDCCREDAEGKRGAVFDKEGLATLPGPQGSLVMYATAEGQFALDVAKGEDGKECHGQFTAALLDHLGKPGVTLQEMAVAVRKQVMEKTEGEQTPEHVSRMTRFGLCLVRPPPLITCPPAGSCLAADGVRRWRRRTR